MPQCANKAAERSITSIEVRTPSTPKAPANDPDTSFQEKLFFICYALIAVDYGALETLPASLFSDITEQLNCSEMETSYLILGRTLGYCGATFATAFVMDKVEASHRYYSSILILGVIATVLIPIVSEYYVQIMLWAGWSLYIVLDHPVVSVSGLIVFILSSDRDSKWNNRHITSRYVHT